MYSFFDKLMHKFFTYFLSLNLTPLQKGHGFHQYRLCQAWYTGYILNNVTLYISFDIYHNYIETFVLILFSYRGFTFVKRSSNLVSMKDYIDLIAFVFSVIFLVNSIRLLMKFIMEEEHKNKLVFLVTLKEYWLKISILQTDLYFNLDFQSSLILCEVRNSLLSITSYTIHK